MTSENEHCLLEELFQVSEGPQGNVSWTDNTADMTRRHHSLEAVKDKSGKKYLQAGKPKQFLIFPRSIPLLAEHCLIVHGI